MALTQLNLTVTNASQTIGTIMGSVYVPQNVQYAQIINPNASALVAFTIDGTTPVVNGNGVTITATNAETFDNPAGSTFPLASTKLISNAASQAVTILYA